jgi:hypothetical protein
LFNEYHFHKIKTIQPDDIKLTKALLKELKSAITYYYYYELHHSIYLHFSILKSLFASIYKYLTVFHAWDSPEINLYYY